MTEPLGVNIAGIPALIWGKPSHKVCLCVHGKMASKESAGALAEAAEEKGYQTLSFDLPRHGDRKEEKEPCDIWNGMRDLKIVADYVFNRWQEARLYACSLGAFFSLHAYSDYPFQKCLFQSPIVDMEYLVGKMMLWFDISEERLEREGKIDTPIDTLSWKYFCYVRAHPVCRWEIPTAILFAGEDDLQSRQGMQAFAHRFGCGLTIAEESRHPFMEERDIPVVKNWIRQNL